MNRMLDFECKNGHVFERFTDKDYERCPECNGRAGIVWLSRNSPHRQLRDPIVFWRYSDGSLGVAGGADSITPQAAERVEARSFGEYRRLAKELNSQLKSKENRREERFLREKEEIEKAHRAQLISLMGDERDPAARDLYREALERGNRRGRPLSFGEFFSIAMEMDRSNYE